MKATNEKPTLTMTITLDDARVVSEALEGLAGLGVRESEVLRRIAATINGLDAQATTNAILKARDGTRTGRDNQHRFGRPDGIQHADDEPLDMDW